MLAIIILVLLFLLAFAASFVSEWRTCPVRPGDLLRRLRVAIQPRRRAIELVASVVSDVSRASLVGIGGKVLVPNRIDVGLSDHDYDFIHSIDDWFVDQVANGVRKLASRPNWEVNNSTEVILGLSGAASGRPFVAASFMSPPVATIVMPDAATASEPTTAKAPSTPSWFLHDHTGVKSAHLFDDHRLGRSSSCETKVLDPKTSAQHAAFKIKANELWIQDLGSTNGTFVNGSKISTIRLASEDRIRVGTTEFSVCTSDPEATKRFEPSSAVGGGNRVAKQ